MAQYAPMYFTEDLGLALRDLRETKGMTQQELADKLGVNRLYIHKMEQGMDSLFMERLLRSLDILDGKLTILYTAGEES